MEDVRVSFEVAKLCEEKGIFIHTLSFYDLENKDLHNNKVGKLLSYDCSSLNPAYYKRNEIIAAPSQSILQNYLREKHNIYVDAYFRADIINSTKVIITTINNKVYDWSEGEKVKSWDVVYNKRFPLLDEKYKFNLKQYPNNKNYQVETFTREEALEEGLKVALQMI